MKLRCHHCALPINRGELVLGRTHAKGGSFLLFIPDTPFHELCMFDHHTKQHSREEAFLERGYLVRSRLFSPHGLINFWTLIVGIFIAMYISNHDEWSQSTSTKIWVLGIIAFALFVKLRTYFKYERFLADR
jgi:hypothetical protein